MSLQDEVFGNATPQGTITPDPVVTQAPVVPVEEPIVAPPVEPAIVSENQPAPVVDPRAKAEEFYQTKYQNVMGKIRQIDPGLYEHLRQGQGQPAQPTHATQVTPQSLATAQDDLASRSVAEMSAAELLSLVANATKSEVTKSYQEQRQSEALANEQRQVASAVSEFIQTNNIPKEEVTAALQELQSYGIDESRPGGTRAAGLALTGIFQRRELEKQFQTRNNSLSAQTAAQLKAAQLVAQPVPGAPPVAGAKTRDEKILEKLAAVGHASVKQEIFG